MFRPILLLPLMLLVPLGDALRAAEITPELLTGRWRYETVDIAPLLRTDNNVIPAVVWNFGQWAPEAQMTNRTGFLLQGDTVAERILGTGASWKCIRSDAYQQIVISCADLHGIMWLTSLSGAKFIVH